MVSGFWIQQVTTNKSLTKQRTLRFAIKAIAKRPSEISTAIFVVRSGYIIACVIHFCNPSVLIKIKVGAEKSKYVLAIVRVNIKVHTHIYIYIYTHMVDIHTHFFPTMDSECVCDMKV